MLPIILFENILYANNKKDRNVSKNGANMSDKQIAHLLYKYYHTSDKNYGNETIKISKLLDEFSSTTQNISNVDLDKTVPKKVATPINKISPNQKTTSKNTNTPNTSFANIKKEELSVVEYAITHIKYMAELNGGVYADVALRMQNYTKGEVDYILDSYSTWIKRGMKNYTPADYGSAQLAKTKNERFRVIHTALWAGFKKFWLTNDQITDFKNKISG